MSYNESSKQFRGKPVDHEAKLCMFDETENDCTVLHSSKFN